MISTNIENIAKGLVDARTTLASHLTVKGVTASKDERLNDLIAKVLDITTGVTPSYQEKTFTENGTFLPDEGFDAFSKVTISVQGGGGADGTRWVLNEDAYLVDEDGNKWCKEELYYGSTNTGVSRPSNVPYSKETTYEDYLYYNVYDMIGKTTLYNGFSSSVSSGMTINGELMTTTSSYLPSEYGLYEVGLTKACASISNFNNINFSGNTRIKECVVNNSSVQIKSNLYSGCTNLEKATILNCISQLSMKNQMSDFMFYGCTKLKEAIIYPNVTNVGWSAFCDCSSLTSVTIPNSVTEIKSYAFKGCSSLTSITIPDSVTSIGASAFYGCASLSNVTIPDSVTEIRSNAFDGCTSLSGSFTFPTGVTQVNVAVLYNTSVSRVVINNVESIGDNAFQYCSKLVRIDCYSPIAPTLGSNCFKGLPNSGIVNVPKDSDYSTWQEVLPNWEFRYVL